MWCGAGREGGREASGEARGCCTFNSSVAIWSVPLREKERSGGGFRKSCVPPIPPHPTSLPPSLFFVMAPGRTCGGGGGRGRRGAQAHLHLITLRLLARYKTLCRAGDPSDKHTVIERERERQRETETCFLCSGSAYHYQSSGKINKAIESCLFLLRRLIGINIIFPSGISFTRFCRRILLLRIIAL